MPSSAVHTFTDPDEYAVAIRATKAEITVTGRGQFAAKLVKIDLHRMWLQRFCENLPRVGHSANVPGRAAISFLTDPGSGLVSGGREIPATGLLRHVDAFDYHQLSPSCGRFGSMSLPMEDISSFEVMAGLELTPPPSPLLHAPAAEAIATLRRLHAAAGHLAEEAPEIIANPDSARGLEQALTAAMVACLGNGQERQNRLALGQHAIVMRRFRRVLEEHPDQPLYIPEICRVIRVSERTLRLCCQEQLGMSPKHYLVLRRMQLARRALRVASPGTATVTDIATRFGFWQLGRFAVEYKTLFGEAPSITLRRQPDERRPLSAEIA